MGTEREPKQAPRRGNVARKPNSSKPPPAVPMFSLRDFAGNRAIQRRLKGDLPIVVEGETLDAVRRAAGRKGVWRESAAGPELKPEDFPGILTIRLPQNLELSDVQRTPRNTD